MKFRSLLTAICVLTAAQIASAAPFAYIANSGNKTVSVIDTADNSITATVTLPDDTPAAVPDPYAYSVAVGASGQKVYVGLQDTNEVVVIDAATYAVIKRIYLVADSPGGLAVNAAETRLYVAVNNSNTLRVIDISGSGATEVGRVNVEEAATSNPEGVVLNPAGNKAYVANSTTNTVAEIALNEATNTYTRTSLINTGAGSYPMGLAISADGTKLYFASLNGNTGVVNTSTMAVTSLPTDLGNVSIAINPVDSNVYAPANSTDTLYAYNSAATLLGSYPAAAGPWGTSVTPDGEKLYVTMNTGTAGNTVKVFSTADLAATPATITLPAGTKPTSFGKFIGPALPWTIAASAYTPCTISPSGTVYVTQGGARTFEYPLNDCKAKVNGTLVTPDSTNATSNFYSITNVTDNSKTINILPMYTLTASWTGEPGGYLVSTPAGITNGTPSFKFLRDSATVEIKANTGFTAQNWTGDCAFANPGSSCTFTNLDGPKTFGAEMIPSLSGPFYNVTQSVYYQTWAECTAANNGDFIKLSTNVNTLSTDGGTAGYQYKLSSQWDQNSSNHSVKGTYASLPLIITNIAIIADDLTL